MILRICFGLAFLLLALPELSGKVPRPPLLEIDWLPVVIATIVGIQVGDWLEKKLRRKGI